MSKNNSYLVNLKIDKAYLQKLQWHQFTNHKYHSFFDQGANREGIEEPQEV